jgi:hypothetical protein
MVVGDIMTSTLLNLNKLSYKVVSGISCHAPSDKFVRQLSAVRHFKKVFVKYSSIAKFAVLDLPAEKELNLVMFYKSMLEYY